MKRTVLILIMLLTFSVANSQVQRTKNSIFRVDRTDLGVGLGTTFYLGDFNEYYPFMSPRYYGSIMHRYSFDMLHSLRTSITVGKLAGNSHFYNGYLPYYSESLPELIRDLQFDRLFVDFNTGVEIGFDAFDPVLHQLERKVAPYLFVGIGMTLLYPDSYRESSHALIASQQFPDVYGNPDDNSSTLQAFNIPIGVGVKWSPWKRWTLAAEWQFKKTFTDNIDRFNNINPNPDLNNSKKGSVILNTDWVSLFGFSISYRLAPKFKCPAVMTYEPPRRSLTGKNRYYDNYDRKGKKGKRK